MTFRLRDKASKVFARQVYNSDGIASSNYLGWILGGNEVKYRGFSAGGLARR